MLRLDHLIVTTHRQTLGIGQSLLELGRQFVHPHGNLPNLVTDEMGIAGEFSTVRLPASIVVQFGSSVGSNHRRLSRPISQEQGLIALRMKS